MPRFVVLEHDHPLLHWDLLLEAGSVLQAWRLSAPPAEGARVRAERSFDHRLVYLDYEGPISGGRGSVVRWDHGTFTWAQQEELAVVVDLAGEKLRGRLSLLWEEGAWQATFAAGA
jgi:hypothetical protein